MLKEQSLFDGFLQSLLDESAHVSIFLINGIKLQGQLNAFDDHVVILKSSILQLVFRHAISTVVPNKSLF